MRRRSHVVLQVLVIAGIHLLLLVGFVALMKSVMPREYAPRNDILLHVVTGAYLALASLTIWLVMSLDHAGIRCSDAMKIALIPVNSIVAATMLRAAYAGVQRLKRR